MLPDGCCKKPKGLRKTKLRKCWPSVPKIPLWSMNTSSIYSRLTPGQYSNRALNKAAWCTRGWMWRHVPLANSGRSLKVARSPVNAPKSKSLKKKSGNQTTRKTTKSTKHNREQQHPQNSDHCDSTERILYRVQNLSYCWESIQIYV